MSFFCVVKCICRSQDHSQKVFKLILNCYELSKSTDSEPQGHIGFPPIMLTIEPRVVNKFCARSPTSFIHMSFWCPFLEYAPNHLHSNIGVRLR